MKTVTMLSLAGLLCAGGCHGGGDVATASGDRPVARDRWALAVKLDAPDLKPRAVQWAVLDRDPVPGFKQRLKAGLAKYAALRDQPGSKVPKDVFYWTFLRVNWNRGFAAVGGHELYLLYPPLGRFSASTPPGKRWLVTKARVDGRGYLCWSIPFEAAAGRRVEVALTRENALDLAAAAKGIVQP